MELAVIPPLTFLATMLASSAEVAAVMVGLFVGARSARSLAGTLGEGQDAVLGATSKASAPV